MKRALRAPEVLQTSSMDCGPATLKCILDAYGIDLCLEKLRLACLTGADGTSLDSIEDLARELGFDGAQEMAPASDAVAILAKRTPCIAVVKGSGGAPHFVVVYRVLGPFVELMDPACGRRIVSREDLRRELYQHRQELDEDTFREVWPRWGWSRCLDERCARLGVATPPRETRTLVEIDAAARFVDRLAARGAAKRRALPLLLHAVRDARATNDAFLPPDLVGATFDGEGTIVLRGALFLPLRPLAKRPAIAPRYREALGQRTPSVVATLKRHLAGRANQLIVVTLVLALLIAFVSLGEMLLLRAAFDAQNVLALPEQRAGAVLAYAVVVVLLLLIELGLGSGASRLGRLLELRVRVALLEKLPRLPDAWFRTRPMSDVAHRSFGLFQLKALPQSVLDVFKSGVELLVSGAALCLVHPTGAPFTLVALAFAFGAPWIALRLRRDAELRVQSHAGALAQLQLDVLLGLLPLRTHGAELAVRTRQEEHLTAWRLAARRAIDVLARSEAVQAFGVALAITGLVLHFAHGAHDEPALLLLVFWALRLPLQARGLGSALQRLPEIWASTTRLADPLNATETKPEDPSLDATFVMTNRHGARIQLDRVSVVLGTERVLDRVSIDIPAGAHVAIVGSSGAGKSSLLAALLGLLDEAEGTVRIDGVPREVFGVERLRRETVWVDPAVQLWNRSLTDNVHFGNPRAARGSLHEAMEVTDLKLLVERLPRGFATELGESGARVSGGEGQRVRLARGLLRRGARIYLLDEAFRGVDRRARKRLSRAIRERVGKATVLEVTHDVADTLDFDHVLVIEDGELVEQGSPALLLDDPRSRYTALVHADRDAQRDIWDAPHWKRLIVSGEGHVATQEVA